MSEILLTAAQSALAVVLLSTLRLSLSGALLLFCLFVGQLVLPGMAGPAAASTLGAPTNQVLFTALYLTAAVALFLSKPSHLMKLREGVRVVVAGTHAVAARRGAHAVVAASVAANSHLSHGELERCRTCEWKLAAQARLPHAGRH